MATFVRPAAYAASMTLAAQGVAIARSHLSEVIAALLGYGTLAALQSEGKPGGHPLEDAQLFVLNEQLGSSRAEQLLGLGSAGLVPTVVAACAEAIRGVVAPWPVFRGMEPFYKDHFLPEVDSAIDGSEDIADVMASSNASYPGKPVFHHDPVATSSLWAAPQTWAAVVGGQLDGEYDPDGDRMFNGDTITFQATITYAKSGRAGLVKLDEQIAAAMDEDSWRED